MTSWVLENVGPVSVYISIDTSHVLWLGILGLVRPSALGHGRT